MHNEAYWEQRYLENDTPWDIGYPAPAIIQYFEQVKNKEARILIPGAGNAHEAVALYNMGFKNITVLDLSDIPLKHFAEKNPDFPKENLVHQDFFEHHSSYEYIVEQTFFCALHPSLRNHYVEKMHELLVPGGKLVGMVFNDLLNTEHPPYGALKADYEAYFAPMFTIEQLTDNTAAIPPRAGRELFLLLQK